MDQCQAHFDNVQYRKHIACKRCVSSALQDPILGITEAYLACKSPDKINLGVVRRAPPHACMHACMHQHRHRAPHNSHC